MKKKDENIKPAVDEGKDASGENYNLKFILALGAMVLALGFGVAQRYQLTSLGLREPQAPKSPALKMGEPAAKKIKYWHDPMDPTDISDKPGKSRMGMDYVPVYEEEGQGQDGVIRIDPAMVQNIGVRTEQAAMERISSSIRTVGVVAYDETKLAKIQSKVQGWVEKLYVNSTGERINKDTILLEIFSPDLVATQEEFLLALSYRDSLRKGDQPGMARGGEDLLEASRRRLRLFDVPEHQVAELEKTRKVKKTLHIHSTAEGVVIKKDVVEGMQVMPGETMYEVADLSRVWVNANVYESEIPLVSIGQEALFTLIAAPGKFFKGKITYIFPFMDPKTRTVTVRLEFANPKMELKPDMYGQAIIQTGSARQGVTISSQAVLRTGERAIVFIDLGEGRFAPREVAIGTENEGRMEILSGVKAGERVVISAQFLMDSESKLREAISKMTSGKPASAAPSPAPKQAQPAAEDNSKMDHSNMPGMDHSKMDHSQMNH